MDEHTRKYHEMIDQRSLLALWFHWVIVTIVIGIVCWGVIAGMAFFTFGLGLLGAGSALGLGVGWVQERILRHYAPYQDWSRWVWYTILGATLCWLLAAILRFLLATLDRNFINHPILPVIVFSIGGSIFGLLQYLPLKNKRCTFQWVLANTIGWSLGAFLGLNIAEIIMPFQTETIVFGPPHAIYVFVAGSVGTFVFGIITGMVLPCLLQQPDTEFTSHAIHTQQDL
jgi:hypothetical protein